MASLPGGVSFLWSPNDKLNGGDIGTIFGRLMVNDGEMGSQSDVSIRTASSRVVGVACVVKCALARSRDNLLAESLDLLPSVRELVGFLLKLFGATSATVTVVRPPGSISV